MQQIFKKVLKIEAKNRKECLRMKGK